LTDFASPALRVAREFVETLLYRTQTNGIELFRHTFSVRRNLRNEVCWTTAAQESSALCWYDRELLPLSGREHRVAIVVAAQAQFCRSIK
jgi:hypothetical protein